MLSREFAGQALPSYILNNFIGVLNEEVIGEYDKDYLLWLAQDNEILFRNLIDNLYEKIKITKLYYLKGITTKSIF
jgi:hypothetical protein